MNIYRTNQFKTITKNIPTKVEYGEVTTNKYGGRNCKVKYDGKDFLLQTPRMRLPYGLSVYQDPEDKSKPPRYSLDFSFSGYELDEDGNPGQQKIRDFYDLCHGLEERLVTEAYKNSSTWLNMDEANEGVARALTRDLLRFSKDKETKKKSTKWPPTLKAKVGFWEGKFTVKAYDEDKNLIDDLSTFVVKGTEAVAILKLYQVNFASGKVGYDFRVQQVRLYRPAGIGAYAFEDDSDDEKPVRTVVRQEADDDDDDDDVKSSSNKVEDSSSDEDDEDEDDELDVESEEEEVEEVKPKKKRGRKKKN